MFQDNELLFLDTELSRKAKISGDFQQKLLIVTLEVDLISGQPFLEKMLQAAQYQLAKDALLVALTEQEKARIVQLISEKQPERVLVFGIAPEQLCLNITAPAYTPFSFHHTQWLFADRLPKLEPDKNLKGQLWTAMKAFFHL